MLVKTEAKISYSTKEKNDLNILNMKILAYFCHSVDNGHPESYGGAVVYGAALKPESSWFESPVEKPL